jgi:hypothetical protein
MHVCGTTTRGGGLLSIFILVAFSSYASAWDRVECIATVRTMLINGSLQDTDNNTFYTNQFGSIMADPENPVLTLDGCERICGANKDWYKDPGPRLNVWLIPVILLITNMEVSPLDKRRYLMVVHLLGDPIDSLWSLLSKIEAWSRCYSLAKLDRPHNAKETDGLYDVVSLATVLAGIEELLGPQTDPLSDFKKLIPEPPIQDAPVPDPARENISIQVNKAAFRLADGRTDELVRTFFAVTLYIYQIIAAFVSVIGGGNSSPPGGRIGTAMFLTWLIPIVLLSNCMGGFNSRRLCYDTMREFCKGVERDGRQESHLTRRISESCEYFQTQRWRRSVNTYIPRKAPSFMGKYNDHSPFHLLVVAMAPLINASAFGSSILWNTPPGGLSCRNIMIIVITMLWFVSALLTWIISRVWSPDEKIGWYLVFAKDTPIAISSILMIFLSSVGVFNSCRCWSGIYFYGRLRAHVPLNTDGYFEHNNKRLYPILVGVCLGMQLILFIYMVFIGRRGLKVMRWSEKAKSNLHQLLR